MVQQVIKPDEGRLWKEELVHIERDRANYHVSPGYYLEIKTLPTAQPFHWLRLGLHDLGQHYAIAIGYGAVIALVYALIVGFTLSNQLYEVMIQLTAGFILLAPMMALGFYGVSRKLERSEHVSFSDMFSVWRINPKGVLGMGLLIVLLFLTWFMVSMSTAAALAQGQEALGAFLRADAYTNLTLPMALGYLSIGLVYMLVVFGFAAVSIPLLMDRPETDAITALVISWNAVMHNWKPMLLWAVLIAVITAVGLAVFYVGLAITMPLLGFASWHAYRDTLGEWREAEEKQPQYY
ncbi:MAG TPA: DUF2189 domain-containing protein [Gammaproteobacteria bacterium]